MQEQYLVRHLKHLSSQVSQLAACFETYKRDNHILPMVITTTAADAAKSNRKAVVDLLNSDGHPNVIGTQPDRRMKAKDTVNASLPDHSGKEIRSFMELLSVVTTDELIENMSHTLQDLRRSKVLVLSIAGMRLFKAQVCEYNPENEVYCVNLINYQDSHRNQLARELFRTQCAGHGISIKKETRYFADRKLYRIRISGIGDLSAVGTFEGVLSVREERPLCFDRKPHDEASAALCEEGFSFEAGYSS